MRHRLVALFVILGWSVPALPLSAGDAGEALDPTERTQAFWKFFRKSDERPQGQPPGLNEAAAWARADPKFFLPLLKKAPADVSPTWVHLIEGEIHLVQGRKTQALACYRAVAQKIGATQDARWDDGFIPVHQFLTEAERTPAYSARAYDGHSASYAGSHRDNWLLRRFLALEAWDDAEREFTRVGNIHRRHAAFDPYRYLGGPHGGFGGNDREFENLLFPCGFSSWGLLFTLDHAFFLKQRNKSDQALELLLEPLLVKDPPMELAQGQLVGPRVHSRPVNDKAPRPTPLQGDPAERSELSFLYQFGFDTGSGMSLEEYVRLVFGEFRLANEEPRLVKLLETRASKGHLRSVKVLALVRRHQGRPRDALALDLQFLQKSKLPAHEEDFRRGQTFDAYQEADQAITAYEKVLARPADKERDAPARRDEAIDRLLALYSVRADTGPYLDLLLRQFELRGPPAYTLARLQECQRRFESARQAPRFRTWLQKQRAKVTDPSDQVVLALIADDVEGALQILAKSPAALHGAPLRGAFKERGRELDYLRLYTSAEPNDLRTHWELMWLENRQDSPQRVALMEKLLEEAKNNAHYATDARRDARGQTYKTLFAFAYHLLRLYESAGEKEKLLALGRRLLRGEPPFAAIKEDYTWREEHLWDQYDSLSSLEASVLLLLDHFQEDKDLELLRRRVSQSGLLQLQNQLSHRDRGLKAGRRDPFTGKEKTYAKVTVRTVGLPGTARWLTSRDDVHAVSADGAWVGTSWGAVRYRELPGNVLEITQIPLRGRAAAFLATPAGFFVSTPLGLYRVADADAAEPRPVFIPILGDAARDGYAMPLTWWRDQLWIESAGYVFQYDPSTGKAVQHGAPGDIWAPQPHIGFVPGLGKLWSARAVVAGPKDDFQPLDGKRAPYILAVTGKEIWARAEHTSHDYRLGLVDPNTLRVTSLAIDNLRRKETIGDFTFLGEDADHVWFFSNQVLQYQRSTGAVTLIRHPAKKLDNLLGPRFLMHRGHGLGYMHVGSSTYEPISRPGDQVTCFAASPDVIRFGAARAQASRDDGGLFAYDPATKRLSKLGHAESALAGAHVHKITFDEERDRAYVATDGGLTILSLSGGAVVGRYTYSDGLPSNRVVDAVRLGDKLCVACAPYQREGGLAVIDLTSGRLRRLHHIDGLPSYQFKELRVQGDKVHILFNTFDTWNTWEHRHDFKHARIVGKAAQDRAVVTFPSMILDPKSLTLAQGDEIVPPGKSLPTMPILGGAWNFDVQYRGKRYLGGAFGLLILDDPKAELPAPWKRQEVVFVPTRDKRYREEAKNTEVPVKTPRDLARWLASPNSYLRENAMHEVPRGNADYLPILAQAARDRSVNVRQQTLSLLRELKGADTMAILQVLSQDEDATIREPAIIAQALQGKAPDWKQFAALAGSNHSDRDDYCRALAMYPCPESFALLLETRAHEIFPNGDKNRDRLGQALVEQPRCLEVVLRAHVRRDRPKPTAQLIWLYQAGGPKLIAPLTEALKSSDRVIRANAALGLGALSARTAIPNLRQALDLESGLSRAAIVKALGKLRAREAVPDLIRLFQDTSQQPTEGRRRAGVLASQGGVSRQASYERIASLASIKHDWVDLRAAFAPSQADDPIDFEELLSAEMILQALEEIGAADAPEFYRALAGSSNHAHRLRGIAGLANARSSDRALHVKMLRHLTGDDTFAIVCEATVSLYLLGQDDARPTLAGWLKSKDVGTRMATLQALLRVRDPHQLDFAVADARRIAATEANPLYLIQQAQRLLQHIAQTKKPRSAP
ncbi:MAG TPA: HEAT repeat domain-containing protein [Gemmataceae bacterium]|nr:HEAT repeat domain-containing protein [Gemmataceae bacterium]